MSDDFDPVQVYGEENLEDRRQRSHREQMLERPLPHSAEAERAVLGSILLDNSVFDQAAEMLVAEDFYVRAHQFVFRSMFRLSEKHSEIDPLLLSEDLRKEGELEQAGGMTAISELSFGLPFYSNVASYCKIVKDFSKARQGIKIANKATSEFLEGEDEVDAIYDHLEEMVFEVRQGRGRADESFTEASELVASAIDKAAQYADLGKVVTGIPTGYAELDAHTHGFQDEDLIIVAARPAMGKTSLAMCMAENVAFATDEPLDVAVFSLEMSKQGLAGRIACSLARVDHHRFRSGYLNKQEWERLAGALTVVTENPYLHIDDTPAISVASMRRKLRRLDARLRKKVDKKGEPRRTRLIVADYLQLMSGSARRSENRQQEVSQISRDLKALAKEFRIPNLVLSQLNRSPDTRSNHRPQLSDLRESGSIEQDADLVAFIYREEEYGQTEENQGVAELIIAKNRNGPTGTVNLSFLKEFTRFENMWKDETPGGY